MSFASDSLGESLIPSSAKVAEDGLNAARTHASTGDIASAVAIAGATCRRWPEDPRAWIEAASLLQSLSFPGDADHLLAEGACACPASVELFQKYVGAAEVARDWPAAVTRWQEARSRWPDRWEGITGGASALVQLGELDAAEDLIAAGEQQHPDIFWVRLLRARILTARREFERALPAWAVVRNTWPDAADGYFGIATCLRELARHDEAEDTLRDAVVHLPDNIGLAIDFAVVAETRTDWPEADARWRAVRKRFPNQIEAYLRPAIRAREQRRFDDAEALLVKGILRMPERSELYVEYARTAELRDEWPHAEELWAVTRARFPHLAVAWVGEIAALKASGQHDAAALLTRAAMDHFPDEPRFMLDAAHDAVRRRALDEALTGFEMIRAKSPQEPAGYHGACSILRQQNRFEEADAVIELGLTRVPHDPAIALEYAWCGNTPPRLAEHGLAEGIRRLESLRANFPGFDAGYTLGVGWLRESGRLEDARALADEAIQRFPESVELARAHAELDRGDAERLMWIDRFRTHLGTNPRSGAAYIGLAQMLLDTNCPDEAEATLQDAKSRLGPSVWLAKAYAHCAEKRGDWLEAVRRWSQTETDFPGDQSISFAIFRARMRCAEHELVPGTAGNVNAAKPGSDPGSTRDLMMQFESLGADPGGCEFGLIQREFQAEPLGLLRWATITAADLTLALDLEFAGVGDPDNTELTVNPSGARFEYTVADRRYGMMMHTFVYTDEVPFDRMFQQICRRLAFLRGKLLDDLRSGEKIFVWRKTPVNLTDSELDALYTAMRRYGDNTLLYVGYNDEHHPDGQVQWLRPGLLRGHVDRFITGRNGVVGPPVTQTWVKICGNAYRLWQQA